MSLSNLKPRSDSAVVRNHMAEIEEALARGASRKDVYEALKTDHDLTLTFGAFTKALYRARTRTKKTGKHDPEAKNPGSYNPTPKSTETKSDAEQSKSEPETESDSAKETTNRERRKTPLKKGGFAPPDDFDPTEFDTRFTRGK